MSSALASALPLPSEQSFIDNRAKAEAFVARIDRVMRRASGVEKFFAGHHHEQGSSRRVEIRFASWEVAQPKGTIVLLGGRTEYIEKHAETIERLLAAGYDVWSMDWRGQGRSTRLLENPYKGFVRSMVDFGEDVRIFCDRIVRWRGDFRGVIAHSMGCHGLTRGLLLPGWETSFDLVVLSGAMMQINLPLSPGVARLLSGSADRVGLDHAYGPGQDDPDLATETFAENSVTLDPGRYWGPWLYERQNPDLLLGGVTWGWLAAAIGSTEYIFAPGRPESLAYRHLMLLGSDETVVLPEAIRAWHQRLPNSELIEYAPSRHEILHESDAVYEKAIADILARL